MMLTDCILFLYQRARRYLTWSQILACGVASCVVLYAYSASAQEFKTFIDEKYGFRVEYLANGRSNTVGTNIRLLVESKTSDACFFHVGVAPGQRLHAIETRGHRHGTGQFEEYCERHASR
jgi:hypothetical protein